MLPAVAVAVLALCAAGHAEGQPTARTGIDVMHYDIDLDLPDTGSVVRGRATLTVQHASGIDSLVLDLVGMTADDVRVDGRPVRYHRTRETIRLALPAASARPLQVTVAYHGEPSDGLIIRTDALGRWTAFGDNWPNRARHWIPSVDHPSDKATVAWTVRAPRARTVVANGVLADRAPLQVRKGGAPRVRTRWIQRQPIPTYLMVIAAAPLAPLDLGETACGLAERGGCVPQQVYVRPELLDRVPSAFRRAGEMVAHFAGLVGPFPYDKLAHLQSTTIFGGMENASAIFYDARLFESQSLDEGLVAHETAHQWFGNAVTEREWSHLWLSEGFATYFAALWTEHARGDSAFAAQLRTVRARVLRDTAAVTRRPVLDTAQTNLMALLNANSYQKGGLVLHMLRRQIGDSAFFRGVRRYVARHRHGTALTADLRAAMEEEAGVALGWFFDQWLRRPGYPELTLDWAYDAAARRVVLTARQGERFGAFRLPLTVALVDAAGSEHRATVKLPATATSRVVLPVELSAPPARVVFEPAADLLAAITGR